jgi:hypothetical protein
MDSVPTYLAFLTVSNGCQDKLPSLSDRKHHIILPFSSGDDLLGYCGQGLGSFLFFYYGTFSHFFHLESNDVFIVSPALSRIFLFFYGDNEDPGNGWMKEGFVCVFGPCDPVDCNIVVVRDRYTAFTVSLLSF